MKSPRSLVFATRRSQLALAQSRAFAAALCRVHSELRTDELHVITTGDRVQDRPLTAIGGKGLFVKEIEQALLDGKADFAVHSIKDVPGELAPGLCIACIPIREDPRDAFVSRTGQSLDALAPGSRVGTSSLRRKVMVQRSRCDLQFEPLRGNVDTRLRKVREGVVDATLLACAGLNRLGLIDQATQIMPPEVSLPAVGQGALGIECRIDDATTRELLRVVHHEPTARAVAAERGVMIAAEGSCQVPIAAYAENIEGHMRLRAMLATHEGDRVEFIDQSAVWPSDDATAEEFGMIVGRRLRALIGS